MPEHSQFVTLLKLLGRDRDTIRLGFQKPEVPFSNAPVLFENVDTAVEILTGNHLNVWFEINQSNYTPAKGRSSEQNITRLSALYADLDFKDGGLGDLNTALEVVEDLSSHLGYQPSAIVYTGGGVHPYWPVLDGEIDDDTRNEMATRLKRWGALVKATAKAHGGEADSVYDLPRILRVPGSTNFKGVPTPSTAEFFDGSAVDVAWIDEVLNDLGITVDTVEANRGVVSAAAEWDWADHDCSAVDIFRREIETSEPTARHPWALKWGAMLYGMVRYGCVAEGTFNSLVYDTFKGRFEFLLGQGQQRAIGHQEFNQVLAFGLTKAQSWSKLKLAEEMRNHEHGDMLDAIAVSSPTPVTLSNVTSILTGQPVATSGNLALAPTVDTMMVSQNRIMLAAFTDTGNAENLQYSLAGKFIFVPGVGWHSWSDGVWVIDQKLSVQEAAKSKFVDMLNNATDDAARKWAHGSLSQGKIKAALALASSLPMLLVDPADLDNSAFELNTREGVINLRSGQMRQPDPTRDFHTKRTGMVPKRMPTPKWDAFLKWAIVDDARISYIQRLFGSAAVGKLLHHHFPIFLGSAGANGKTTMLDVISGCLGMYAAQMPARFLIESRGDDHPTTIAQLRGVRLAISSEVPPTARFNEDLVKQLTGETTLRARYMGKDFFEFENVATHILVANHLPSVPVGGRSFWRRVRKVDFNNFMPIDLQNPHLVFDLLSEEGPGIMQWIIDGAVDMLANGMQEPQGVLDATTEYQLEEDTMARFVQENLREVEAMQVDIEVVYERYKQWTIRQGLYPLTMQKFKREIHMLLPMTKVGTPTVFSNLALVRTQWEEMYRNDDE